MSASPSPDRWARVKVVFSAAAALPAERRPGFLEGACAGDAALRREVEALLASHEQADGFLSSPAPGDALLIEDADDDTAPLLGRRIGPYRVLAEIGRGGMGSVYSAVRADDQYEQRVAIKLVKRGLDSESVLQRFRSERQILAGFDHPNIARLLDGGTTDDGRPYFVMEHIEGLPVTEYADRHHLGVPARLQLFRAVCAAVQYAHQHLVVHRDIKPTNILVTSAGIPKLLDFGIAKLLDPTAFPETVAPTMMGQRLMTPHYASPEQVRGEPITTAADVYALGVLLYELLTGRRPHRLRSVEPAELVRAICEEEPIPPSEALALPAAAPLTGTLRTGELTLTLQPAQTTEARKPDKLRRELVGDLDTIVMMALRKEPARRYASVEQLSEDLRRYLEGRPVTARKDTLLYRAGKFVRRNRASVGALVAFVLALSAGVATTVWQARVARAERARAERRFADVRRLATSFLFEFHDAIETLPGSTRARQLVVTRALEYLDSLAAEADDPALRHELAEAYRRVGDVQGNPYFANLGDTKGALASYRKALALDEAAAAKGPTLDNRLDVSSDHNKVGDLLLQMGDMPQALTSHRRALEAARQLQAEATTVAVLRRVFVAETKMGEVLARTGDLAGSRDSYARALVAAESQAAQAPADARARRDLSVAHVNVGDARGDAGDARGALESYNRALAIREAALAADPASTRARYDVAAVLERKGTVQAGLGDLEGALATQRRGLEVISAMAAADPANVSARRGVGISQASVGQLLGRLGRHGEALAALDASLEVRRGLVAGDPSNAAMRTELAETQAFRGSELRALGRGQEACRALAESAEVYGALAGAGQLPADHEDAPKEIAALRKGC